jgi:hypothetical protein
MMQNNTTNKNLKNKHDMKKIKAIQFGIAAILLLCAVLCIEAQTLSYGLTGRINTDTTTSIDTVRVVLLTSDTVHYYNEYMQSQSCEDVGCKDTTQIHFNSVSHFKKVKEDKGNYGSGQAYWTYGYSVRRKECCVNGYSGEFAIYKPVPYYTHLLYLDDKKQLLKSTVIVWQSVIAN